MESSKGEQVREIPRSDHDAILQLWYALIGTNGSGLVTRFEEMEKLFPHLVTKEKCAHVQETKSNTGLRVFGYIKDVALVVLAVLAVLKGVA